MDAHAARDLAPLTGRKTTARPRRTLAFVLSGGASAGAYQVGALLALTDAGIAPDLVVGTSVGALNAAAYAADPSPDGLERLAKAWAAVRRQDIFQLRPAALLPGLAGRSDHLLPNAGLARWITAHLALDRLEKAAIPLHVTATDLADGAAVVLSDGPAVPALLASSAIPGLFPPVTIEGRRLIDGGAAADTPVRQAEQLGATDILVLPAFAPSGLPSGDTSAAALLTYGYERMCAQLLTSQTVAGRHRLEIVPLPEPDGRSPFDFSTATRRITAARHRTGVWLRQSAMTVTPLRPVLAAAG